jgi:glutamate-1-semialdehyde 2,1-aminomutase
MDYLAPEGPVYQAGTLSGNPLAMSAGSALLELLIEKNPYDELEKKSSSLLSGMSKIMQTKGIEFSHAQIGGMFGFFFAEKLPQNFNEVAATDDVLFIKFLTQCMLNGIYFAPSKFEAGFISTTHSNDVIDLTLTKIEKIMEKF